MDARIGPCHLRRRLTTVPARKPAPASSASDLRAEASHLLSGRQLDAAKAGYRASKLQVFSLDEGVTWESHAYQLNALKNAVDDTGQRVYRLEQTRVQRE